MRMLLPENCTLKKMNENGKTMMLLTTTQNISPSVKMKTKHPRPIPPKPSCPILATKILEGTMTGLVLM